MKGRPKVGEVWVARDARAVTAQERDSWWRYQIVAAEMRDGRMWYIGVKDNGVNIWPNQFDEHGRDFHGDCESPCAHYLTHRSRRKPFLSSFEQERLVMDAKLIATIVMEELVRQSQTAPRPFVRIEDERCCTLDGLFDVQAIADKIAEQESL